MITLEKAKQAIEASEKKAKELGIAVSTAIVDEYGVLKNFSRMEGALPKSPQFALAKANTATLGSPSSEIAKNAGEGKPYMGINAAFGGEFMVLAGGLPVKQGNQILGAVGVGGSPDPNQDEMCAEAARQVLEA